MLQQETRALRAAFNDFARTNVTAGEIEALHADVNRVQAENAELAARLATVERLLQEAPLNVLRAFHDKRKNVAGRQHLPKR